MADLNQSIRVWLASYSYSTAGVIEYPPVSREMVNEIQVLDIIGLFISSQKGTASY